MNMDFPIVNNKLAFFDYDWTLVTHNYSKKYLGAFVEGYFKDCLHMLTAMEEEHRGDKPLPCMQWYTRKLFDNGYGIYVITHEKFNLRDDIKRAKLNEFYPDVPMTYLTVDTPEHKIDMMKAVALSEECELSDVIFVDDRMETVNLAKAAGFDAKYLADIVVLYENQRVSWQQDSTLKPKGLSEILEEDPSLTRKVTYDEMNESGISEEHLEDVYRECRLLAERNGRGKENEDGGIFS